MRVILVLGILMSAASQINAAVNVTLYYESLCIDCVNFIKRQLWPTYQSLGDNLRMDFVPFGKASWTENPWSIRCQHGDRECHGNAIQACALERYKKPEMQVKFVTCVMSDAQPDRAGAKCAQSLGYSYEGIDNCAVGQEGRQLHMKHGRRTKNFRPTITYIPTVAFNDVYNARDQQLSMYQFKQVVCSKFPPGEKPPGCRTNFADFEPSSEEESHESFEPVESVESSQSAEPVEAVESVQPAEPVVPVASAESAESSESLESSESSESSEPVKSFESVHGLAE